jgi:hypothetical protein
MGSASLLECSFLIPVRRDLFLSDGEPHTADEWDWLTENLYQRFDAYTLDSGLKEGQWKSPRTGERMGDQSRQYTVALPPERIELLRQLLAQECVVFRQQCIY